MAERKGKKKSQSSLGVILDFVDVVDITFERLTGKSLAAWFEEFRQRPKELPPGEQLATQEPVMPLVDAYAILGLKPDALLEDVKKHYRQLAKAFHSDKGGMNDEAMKLLNRAFERITKREKGGN